MSITIESLQPDRLTADQASEITTTLVKSYLQYKAYYTDPLVWETYLQEIQGVIYHPHIGRVIIAKKDTKVVGVVLIFKGSELAYNRPELNIDGYIIRLLAVDPDERRQGIAKQLIEACEGYVIQQGQEEIVLHTSDKMSAAIRLYERMGFTRAPLYDFYVGEIHVKSYRIAVKAVK